MVGAITNPILKQSKSKHAKAIFPSKHKHD